jgi:RNA polymerase sigma factor (sigma-70 family)
MREGLCCRCPLCRMEIQLTTQVSSATDAYKALLSSTSNGLQAFASPTNLLSHLRAVHVNARSDELLRELLAARPMNHQFVETLILLAFLPMLHGTVRRVVQRQPTLSFEDVAQQALILFLETLRSEELQNRPSHFAFTIACAVKRQMFEWANREGRPGTAQSNDVAEILAAWSVEESMQRHALLRHFLHSCVTKGLLTDAELDLLIQFKLDGNGADEIGEANSISSNAVRQKMKRLLAKLRRLARR